jgi:hypothetical protein
MWRKELGIDLRLRNQEWRVYLDSRSRREFDILRGGWLGDYYDPNTFLDLFTSDSTNNTSGWTNPDYDRLIAEAARTGDQEKRQALFFEAETLRMTLAIFETLFPLYNKEHGFDELKTAIADILKKQEGQSQIIIEVHHDAVEGIKSHIHSLAQYGHDPHRYDIVGADNLDDDAFRMRWKDVGAVRDLETMAGEIGAIIKDTLAGTLTNSHDSKQSGDTVSPDQEQNTNPEPIPSDPEKLEADQNDTIMETPDE